MLTGMDRNELIEHRRKILREARLCAANLRRTAARHDQLLAERNRICAAALDAGVTTAELGEVFGIQAQSVRWNLNHGAPTPKPRRGRKISA